MNPNNMPTKKQEIKEAAKELLEKATLLHKAFEKSGEREPEVEAEELDRKFQRMLQEIPDEAIRNRVAKIIEVLKNEQVSKTALANIVEDAVALNMEHYFDVRQYVRLARRELAEYRLLQMVDELADRESVKVDDLKKLARLAFDLNGLKAMNDIGGHSNGDEGLRLFSTILREGQTTKWLEDLGFVVIPSAEGGDEFGMIISGLKNDKAISNEMLREITRRYHQEVLAVNAKGLVDLGELAVRKNLYDRGFRKKMIAERRTGGFEFKLSTSVDISRFDEALDEITFAPEDSYKKMARAVVGRMFKLADTRANANKEAFKHGLEVSADPNDRFLFELTSRLDKESIKLRVQNQDLRDILTEKGFSDADINKMLTAKSEARKKEEESQPD